MRSGLWAETLVKEAVPLEVQAMNRSLVLNALFSALLTPVLLRAGDGGTTPDRRVLPLEGRYRLVEGSTLTPTSAAALSGVRR